MDFTVPFMQLGISILFYKADPEPKDMFAFLQPFAKEVWYYMILTQLVITLLFVFMARWVILMDSKPLQEKKITNFFFLF